jgi:hypothetical protein
MGDGTDMDISITPTAEEIIDTETVDEPNSGIETVENKEQFIEDYNMKELKQIAEVYGVKKKFKTKQNKTSINGLQSLNLDPLSVNTMDGDLFYIDKIEAQEIIVDSKLSLTSTGVISVGNTTISDIELIYLDGVSSNIQQQITNVSNNNSGLTSTVNTQTSQISALQTSDTSQNSTLSTHTSQISALQTSDTAQNTMIAFHTTQINEFYEIVDDLYNKNTTQ